MTKIFFEKHNFEVGFILVCFVQKKNCSKEKMSGLLGCEHPTRDKVTEVKKLFWKSVTVLCLTKSSTES